LRLNQFNKLLHIIDYVRFVRNWYSILLLRGGLKDETEIMLRDRSSCTLVIDRRAYATFSGLLYLMRKGARYDPCNDIVEIPYAGRKLHFSGIMMNRYDSFIVNDLLEVYFFEEYGFLDVRGKSVVDVGASIGDSAIYFAAKGARLVKAYEPVPHICRLLKRNVELNKLEDVVSVECSAVVGDAQEGEIAICVKKHGYGFIPRSLPFGECEGSLIRVPGVTISRADVLKIDCEGCEYDVLLSMNEPLFDEIGMEYHDDPSILIDKLKELGYSVKIVERKKPLGEKYHEVGIIHAWLRK